MRINKNTAIKILFGILITTIFLTLIIFYVFKSENNSNKILDNITFSEAPMLSELVTENQLPPIKERLPETPLIVYPLEEIGHYGGTYRRGMTPSADYNSFTRILPEGLLKYDAEWNKILPNLAESFKTNSDATEFTFYLRKGTKWSDGVEFTTDDIMFWWEDLILNKELNPEGLPQSWLIVDGKPANFEKIDDYTFKIKFSKSYGLFPLHLASVFGPIMTSYPKHYAKQFHKDYNSNIPELIDQAGLNDWTELFRQKLGNPVTIESEERYKNTEMPVLNAWIIKDVYGESDKISCERNPYYWKIDSTGQQLPYLDYLEYTVADPDTLAELASQGRIDMQIRHIGDEKYRELFEKNKLNSGYKIFDTLSSLNNVCVIALNMNHEDPVLREIFQNKNFRIGLSYAINRNAVIENVYNGKGTPAQPAPRPESDFYDEELATQYTEYDVNLANEYLDKDYPNKDSQGYRLGPDGKRISFIIEATDFNPSWEQVLIMVKDYWEKVGIEINISKIPRADYDEHRVNNDYDATVWAGDGGMEVLLEPRWYFPYSDESLFAQLWQYWYNNDPRGEEPPADVKKQMELYNELKATGDIKKQKELMRQILEITKEQFYVIGISLPPTGFGIKKYSFENVPDKMIYAWLYPTPTPTNPCQYFSEN